MRYTIIMLLALGCSSNEPQQVPLFSDYLPLKRGVFQIYSVDSIVVDQNVETAYRFELKTLVMDSFPNATGGYSYVIQRSKRVTSSSPWTALGSWSARADSFQAVMNEGNISYVIIATPLANEKPWEENQPNIFAV